MDDGERHAALLASGPPAISQPLKVAAEIVRIGWPVLFSNVVQVAQGISTLWFLGSTGDEVAMAAFGLANVVCGVTGRSMLWGLGSGYDTFASQAWGAKEYTVLGHCAGRVFLLLSMLINVPIVALWLCAEPILIAFGQSPEISSEVAVYAALALPGQFCAAVVCVLTKTLVAMGKTRALLWLNVASVVLGVLLTYLFVQRWRWGLWGAAVSTCFGPSNPSHGAEGIDHDASPSLPLHSLSRDLPLPLPLPLTLTRPLHSLFWDLCGERARAGRCVRM